jgi:hypothetical protein
MQDKELLFSRRHKLYTVDCSVMAMVLATIQENKQLYTKEEVWRTKLVYGMHLEYIRGQMVKKMVCPNKTEDPPEG